MLAFTVGLIIIYLISSLNAVPIEKYLLDSTTFQGELNWDKAAYGDSNELPGWKEQSFSQKNGDVWRVHFVCDIASSNPNNWLRLPFIQREEANRLAIKLEYTIRECKKYPGEIRSCKETFQLLYIESDGDLTSTNKTIDDTQIFHESNFKYLKTIAPNNAITSSGSLSDMTTHSTKSTTTTSSSSSSSSASSSIFRTEVDLPLITKKKGVYIVFRDQGACVSLLSIKVYYTLCSMQIVNLVIFPKTPTGSNVTDLVQQAGHCVDNADSKVTPYAYCQTNGNWFITNDNGEKNLCICRAGYYHALDISQCLACPQGKYKSNASNDQECQQCPANSWTSSTASVKCMCKDGYYRLEANSYDTPCIPYPPEPKNLTVYYLDQTSIKLRWDPISNYEKNMVQYKLECFKCIEANKNDRGFISTEIIRRNSMCSEKISCENYVQIVPKKDEIFENKVSLNSLDSSTQYLIEIYAQHVKGLFKTKTVDIMVRTFDDIKELEIKNITAYQFTDMNQILLVWSDPSSLINNAFRQTSHSSTNIIFNTGSTFQINNPNLFLFYEIRYWPKNSAQNANIVTIKAPAQNFTFKNSNPNVISNNLYVFQIRGQNAKGWGPYSMPVDSLKISNSFLKTNASSASEFNFYSTVFTKDPSLLNFEQLKILTSTSSQITSLNRSESISIYVAIAISSSLCFIIGTMTILVLLSRSGRVKFLSNYLSKPVNNGGSGTNSECDSIDIAKRNAKMAYNQLGPHSAGTSSSGGSSPMWPPINGCKTYIDPHTYEDPTKVVSLFAKELAPSSIIIESVIGGGEFGDVCKGCLKVNPWSETVVAIKTLKGAATEQNRCDFLTEASIMAQFNDPNVVRLEGVVTTSLPLMIVTEYMENGSLDSFLRINENKLKLPQMIKILRDVSSGMRYLSEMNYIHRDLAARNILVNKDMVCKVADFGLSREIESDAFEYTTKGGKIPIRWTAPEACTFRKYSCASDVWSFGVFTWEVLSFGERPYWNWENKDVILAIQEFYRLPPPRNCPDCLYKLMQRCWQDDRSLRPKFSEIVIILDEMFHFPEETKKITKVREVNPINPRAPTKIQMTSTKQFLARLNLEHYIENFHRCGLANLSNLFQLEPKDLSYSLGIHSQYDQKKIMDELKAITISFNQSLNQNSYQQMTLNNHNNFNTCLKTLKITNQEQQQQQQQKQSSIFHLIRNNPTNLNKTEQINVNSQMNNDLLLFSNAHLSTLTQNFTSNSNAGNNSGEHANGFLV